MSRKNKAKPPASIQVGRLPVETINRTLGTELDAGEVIFSSRAQQHAQSRHPNDYPLILPHIVSLVADPLYIGDDWKNGGKIEFIGKIPVPDGTSHVLVAISIEPDDHGNYHIASAYRIAEQTVMKRREKMHLRSPK
ncbi:hypothetical protein E8L99_16490 [Phreatobacter aquaticus]|uniref:Phage-Barnase-EndoU-ColicinE5/D-RelE like nuclease 3 domain-containing protein n=1 Tax=Phreatobacter aquaticus TaxID=2570229 RepID=A0A4D7QHI6_9HYPH|nr:hypothetical protein [Phreatobacter aquaticus]QCK87240.1 hypothetical protein E8L99_16490 [Phreatobacter aquaticus]